MYSLMASWYHPSHIKKPWICPRTKMPSLMKNAAEFDGMRELTVNLPPSILILLAK